MLEHWVEPVERACGALRRRRSAARAHRGRGPGRRADDPAGDWRCARTPTRGCGPRRSRRPIRPSPRRRADLVDDGADRAGHRRGDRARDRRDTLTAAATERRRRRAAAPAGRPWPLHEPRVRRHATRSSPTTSGIASRRRPGRACEEWLASQQRHARHAALRRRRAVHPARRSGAGPAAASHHASRRRPPQPPTTQAPAPTQAPATTAAPRRDARRRRRRRS